MARLPRLTIPGLPHLVVQRGHNGAAVFGDDEDRRNLLVAAQGYAADAGVEVHAWAFTQNRVFWLLTPAHAGALATFMQALGRTYTRQFNRRYGRSGTLWEGRYRVGVLQPGRWVIAAMVFLDTLSVREGLSMHPFELSWSSGAHCVGRPAPHLPDPVHGRGWGPHPDYWALGNTPFAREAAYEKWVETGLSVSQIQSLEATVRQGWVLGDPAFIESLQGQTARRLSRAQPGRPRSRPS
jgi:putative transposase